MYGEDGKLRGNYGSALTGLRPGFALGRAWEAGTFPPIHLALPGQYRPAAVRLADWVEPLLRRERYLALLLERPNVHERLLHMLGAARWPAGTIVVWQMIINTLIHLALAGIGYAWHTAEALREAQA